MSSLHAFLHFLSRIYRSISVWVSQSGFLDLRQREEKETLDRMVVMMKRKRKSASLTERLQFVRSSRDNLLNETCELFLRSKRNVWREFPFFIRASFSSLESLRCLRSRFPSDTIIPNAKNNNKFLRFISCLYHVFLIFPIFILSHYFTFTMCNFPHISISLRYSFSFFSLVCLNVSVNSQFNFSFINLTSR